MSRRSGRLAHKRRWNGRSTPITTMTVLGSLIGCVGVAVGVALAPQSVPTALRTSPRAHEAPVTVERTRDGRTVKLLIQQASPRTLTLRQEGVVTASSCRKSAPLSSGTTTFSLNDDPVVNLATSSPLWRDIRLGDRGIDVKSLQIELTRLGYPVAADGVAGQRTARAVRSLLTSLGVVERKRDTSPDASEGVILPLERLMWLPSPAVVVGRCELQIGQVATGTQVAAITMPEVQRVQIQMMPKNIVPGQRVVIAAAGHRFNVSHSGEVDIPAGTSLESFEAESESDELDPSGDASSDESTRADLSMIATARFELTGAQDAWTVPASALWDFRGQTACVESRHQRLRVRVIASKLGASVVVVEHGSIGSSVALDPKLSSSC